MQSYTKPSGCERNVFIICELYYSYSYFLIMMYIKVILWCIS